MDESRSREKAMDEDIEAIEDFLKDSGERLVRCLEAKRLLASEGESKEQQELLNEVLENPSHREELLRLVKSSSEGRADEFLVKKLQDSIALYRSLGKDSKFVPEGPYASVRQFAQWLHRYRPMVAREALAGHFGLPNVAAQSDTFDLTMPLSKNSAESVGEVLHEHLNDATSKEFKDLARNLGFSDVSKLNAPSYPQPACLLLSAWSRRNKQSDATFERLLLILDNTGLKAAFFHIILEKLDSDKLEEKNKIIFDAMKKNKESYDEWHAKRYPEENMDVCNPVS